MEWEACGTTMEGSLRANGTTENAQSEVMEVSRLAALVTEDFEKRLKKYIHNVDRFMFDFELIVE